MIFEVTSLAARESCSVDAILPVVAASRPY